MNLVSLFLIYSLIYLFILIYLAAESAKNIGKES